MGVSHNVYATFNTYFIHIFISNKFLTNDPLFFEIFHLSQGLRTYSAINPFLCTCIKLGQHK